MRVSAASIAATALERRSSSACALSSSSVPNPPLAPLATVPAWRGRFCPACSVCPASSCSTSNPIASKAATASRSLGITCSVSEAEDVAARSRRCTARARLPLSAPPIACPSPRISAINALAPVVALRRRLEHTFATTCPSKDINWGVKGYPCGPPLPDHNTALVSFSSAARCTSLRLMKGWCRDMSSALFTDSAAAFARRGSLRARRGSEEEVAEGLGRPKVISTSNTLRQLFFRDSLREEDMKSLKREAMADSCAQSCLGSAPVVLTTGMATILITIML
mmetsp:Transcript_17151/g.38095  ORF Transcript_17151/g.38095 Transcript_17151/m.38095 type:complete len:281 (-) Transcript_17151:440-1282(-)